MVRGEQGFGSSPACQSLLAAWRHGPEEEDGHRHSRKA